METPSDVIDLVQELKRKTEQGGLNWSESTIGRLFHARFANFRVEAWLTSRAWTDENDDVQETPVVGFKLSQLPDKELYSLERSPGADDYGEFRQLYEAALLKARNIPGVVLNALNALRSEAMSPLAQELLALHQQTPGVIRFGDANLLAKHNLDQIDEAYAELERADHIKRAKQLVSVQGYPRACFYLPKK